MYTIDDMVIPTQSAIIHNTHAHTHTHTHAHAHTNTHTNRLGQTPKLYTSTLAFVSE